MFPGLHSDQAGAVCLLIYDLCARLNWAHEDVVALYLLALEKPVPGAFYFVESGEAAFVDMTIANAIGLGPNSGVRGKHARELLGRAPKWACL
ncbi:hypothetical protein PSAN_23560 [Pseudomonas antarctica]|uniref:Uncharacterized protein n=1 Tax=Pseudomonas antarctica TaxID=219572 RepID=A0ABQ6ZZU2_9PSED|nr:hypothetical protein PSAN_23560 [Pseudomonas antarctica]